MFDSIKIVTEFLPYPENMLEMKSEKGKDLLIFGRNSSGKTTIAREVYECQNNDDRYQSKSHFSLENEKYILLDSEKVYVYGYDHFIDFKTSKPVFESSDKIEELQSQMKTTEDKILFFASALAKFGGSKSRPDDTLARRLYPFGIKNASYNARTKESFSGVGLEYIKEVCDSEIYQELEKHRLENPSSQEGLRLRDLKSTINPLPPIELANKVIDLSYFKNKYNDEQLKTIKLLSVFPGLFGLKFSAKIWSQDLDKWNKQLDKLNASIPFVKEILEDFNSELALTFFDEQRLRFTLNSRNIYEVSSRGRLVGNLAQLSTAEQNILNLIYFFLKIHSDIEKIKSDANEEPQITILLDDPVSSTDFDNKIGIYSFLRNQIQRLGEKVDLKCIVLTHDEEVFYHFDKTLKDLGRSRETFELVREKGLIPINSENNFYSTCLWNVFNFAIGQKDELNSYIGNIMRKVLEAYSTFNYAIDMEELSTDEEILKKISNDRKNIFERNMYRLLLNSESHTANSFKKTANQSVSLFDIEEKKKTAKIVISLLYSLDDLHLKKHFIFYAKQHEKLKNYKEFKKELDRIDKDINRFETDLKNKQSVPAEYNLDIEETEKQISEKKAERNGLINKNEKLYDMLLINKDADSWWENTESEIQKWLEMNF